MRAKYKVIALSLGGRGKKIYDSGDIITQEQVNAPVEELVKKGFLVLHEEGEVEEAPVEETVVEEELQELEKLEDEVVETENEVETEEEVKEEEKSEETVVEESKSPSIEDATRNSIIDDLKQWGVPFNHNASKKELFEIWKSHNKG